jgi:thiamine biosynthesis lipoprotein
MTIRLPTPENRVERLARKLAVLKELGFEQAEQAPPAAWTRLSRHLYQVTAQRPAMSTLVSLSVLSASRAQAEEAVERAFSEMGRLVGLLNRFDPLSAVGVLNQQGRLTDVPPELGYVVSRALQLHRRSFQTFDVTVQPLVDLSRDGRPSREEWVAALELVGSANVELTGSRIRFGRSGMGITLDGIAKGYIVDRMAEVLLGSGINSFLINAGGDIRTAGTKNNGLPWTVAVQDPSKRGQFPDQIHMTDGAVATSGSYERRYRHIVSSKTGELPDDCVSVTVFAPTALAADALATTLFAMQPEEGLKLIHTSAGCECLIIASAGKRWRSRGWRSANAPAGEAGETW